MPHAEEVALHRRAEALIEGTRHLLIGALRDIEGVAAAHDMLLKVLHTGNR